MNTTERIDARGYLSGWLDGLAGMYCADVNAIPDDKWTASMGGCTRPANVLTADAISLLEWTTQALQGKTAEGGYDEYMAALKQECSTKSGATAKIKSAIKDLQGALNGASEETLQKTVTTPWGMESPMFMVVMIAANHVWYHDGQLNYIHCLLGDDKMHWMGE